MRRVCIGIAMSAGLVMIGCVKGAGTDQARADTSSERPAKATELADSTPANSTRDLCALLSAKEIEEITGLPIERAEKKPNGCEWYAKAAAQQQKGADTARGTLDQLMKQEPKSAEDVQRSMEGLLKGLTGAVAPNKPFFGVSVQWENADQGEITLKGTVAINSAGMPGGGLEPIEGLGDRAFMGAMGAIFYVRKGAALIMFGSTAPREQTIALARRVVPRI